MTLSSTLSKCIVITSSDRDSTMSLGRLFQWMIVLTVTVILNNILEGKIQPLDGL